MTTHDARTARALTREDVKHGLAEDALVLVDVREPEDYARKHIPGSLSHPLSAFEPARLPRDARRIVFTCSAGVRSQHAADAARAAGIVNAAHYQGGIEDWETGGEPIETGPPAADRVGG